MTDLAQARRVAWLQHPALRVGAIASLFFLLVGFISVVWVPYPVEGINVGAAMQDPGAAHWLGTDHLGRDMLSMLMRGILTSFVVAAVAVAIGAAIGVPLGLAAAHFGGTADWIVMRLSAFLFIFPALIVAILLTAIWGPGAVNAMIAIGIFNIPTFARAARDGMLVVKARDYLSAAQLAGLGPVEIVRRHVLPNIATLLVMTAMLQLALGIMAEAGLAYVGLGTQPPATSLGLMLKEAQTYTSLKPSLAVIPGVTVMLLVVALNLVAAGLRQRLAPALQRLGGIRGAA